MHAQLIDFLLRPRSVAVLGASERNFYTRNAIHRLEACGFPGPIHLVNSNREEAFGRRCYPTATSIGVPVDMAFVAVPREAVVPSLRNCAEAGAKAAVVVSNGFGESGDTRGQELQAELSGFLAEVPMAVCGPSCLGVINVHDRFQAFGGHTGTEILPGSIALVSQSGANVHSYVSAALAGKLGFSHIVSTGNEAGIEATEYIDFFLGDPETSVVCAYVESFKEPARLVAVAERALGLKKPIIVIKIGRSEPAARAALAHTGAMTGSDAFYDALFRQYGIIRADTVEEAIERCAIFAASPREWWPSGRRVGIVSVSGGFASALSDVAGAYGVEVPELGPETVAALRSILPPNVRPQNPIDISTQVQRDRPTAWGEVVARMAADPAVDLVLDAEAVPQTRERLEALALCRARAGKPIVVTATSPYIPIVDDSLRDYCRGVGLPVLSGVEGSLRGLQSALAFTATCRSFRPRRASEEAAPPALTAPASRLLHEVEARRVLRPFGIEGPREIVAATADEAALAAHRLGPRVAIKVLSEEIAHRSDEGLVRLDVRPEDAHAVAGELIERIATSRFSGSKWTLVVQEMVQGIAELFLGVNCGVGFAPLVVVGFGGVFVEIMADRSSRIAPVDLDEARSMLRELRLFPILEGYRTGKPGDVTAAARAIVGLSRFAIAAMAWLGEAEINPLVVLPEGQGVRAVDALVISAAARTSP